jgi:diguanylate cyclase (GGDEF)-like protein/PAS domain S-box-containing protein
LWEHSDVQPPHRPDAPQTWLEGLLDVVRRMGETTDPDAVLDLIVRGVVDVLDFGAAAINVVEGDTVRVASVAGPPELISLVDNTSPLQYWLDIFEAAEAWGSLRYFSHERDQAIVDRIANWTPAASELTGPDVWQPDDSLLAPLYDGNGALVGVLSVDQPGSGRHPDAEQRSVLELFAAQAASALSASQAKRVADAGKLSTARRWQLVFENSPIATVVGARDGTFTEYNDAFLALVGYSRDELRDMSDQELTHPEDRDVDRALYEDLVAGRLTRFESEKRFVHADGHAVWVRSYVGAVFDFAGEGLDTIVAQMIDTTVRKRAENRLAHQASHDPLTDLPNRAVLEAELTAAIAERRPTGVLYVDLDRFTMINDSLGHEAGDDLLVAVSERLAESLPPEVVLGRVGGDEFVVLAPDETDPEALLNLARLMTLALQEPIFVRGHEHTVGLSVGITTSGAWHEHADEVLREANQALLYAKKRGRARVEIYNPRLDRSATVADLKLERSLRTAIADRDGFIPYFQPVMSLTDDEGFVGYEALVRWMHPTRGLLEPAQFLPLAEETGLIVPLGWMMLDLGCDAVRELRKHDLSGWVAVNVSGSQLGRGQLPAMVARALADADVDPSDLHIEITETALVDASTEAIAEVQAVADMGVQVALDDFGTGYSSLSLLRNLPVGAVKIDRSFVAPLTHDRNAIAIVRSVISLCRELGITTTAEGVETKEQLAALRALGCKQAQGFLIGNPAPLIPHLK